MNRSMALLILVSLTMIVPIQAQQPTQAPAEDVVRISTNLVQLDAVVTDKAGNPSKNLTPADFEVLQDGRPQKIVSATFVDTDFSNESAAPNKIDKKAPLAPPIRTRLENAGRLLTFVVDDGNCSASPLGMMASRDALEKFVREQMRPNDLVAIYQSRNGRSVLQQFTSDKAQLMRVVRKIHWTMLPGVGCGGATFGGGASGSETAMERASRTRIENSARQHQVVGLVGLLHYVIRGLQKIPGRKSVFVLSDAIYLMSIDDELKGPTDSSISTLRMGDSYGVMQDLVDAANRASVVFYTIDVRGVTTSLGGITASSWFEGDKTREVHGMSGGVTPQSRSGMYYLADETGGRFYHDANDLTVLVRRGLNQEKGYYRIGYQPDEDTFKGKRFNKIEIKVKRPELKVRSHSGFVGVTDESLRAKTKRTGDSELYEAIIAPLPKAGLDLQLSASFGNTETEGTFVRTAIYLDGGQLSFVDEPNGIKKGVFDIVAVTLNEKNEVIEDFNRTHTIRFPALYLEDVRRKGLVYSADVPVKKPGAYNFRVAIRDVNSKQLGSAGQQIEVPDLKKDRLLMSELTLAEVAVKDNKPLMPVVDKAETGFAAVTALSSPAVRHFQPGATLGYSYKIYNAALDKSTRQPNVRVQVRLYREGQLITDGAPQPAQFEPQADMSRISNSGYLQLPGGAAAGEYALQIIVRDLKSNKTASQWIDFEVVR